MNKPLLTTLLVLLISISAVRSQTCTPLGDQVSYGTGDSWIGYLYNNQDLTSYAGYINQGVAGNPNFDQNFGGNNVLFPTNGCAVQTETFGVRYRLTKTFASGTYDFIVGGDDGYRLSLDGGLTWAINNWGDHSYVTSNYSVALNGTYNLVFEYYENAVDNRVSFSVALSCLGTENTSIYGTGNIWRGYVYDNADFTAYRGMVLQGAAADASFDQDFGGSNVYYPTSGCSVQTESFSVRYRLTRSFSSGLYLFTVAGDDGYRLSLDGGLTWIMNKWSVQSLLTTVLSLTLNGTYNIVLEYFENGGDNRVSFTSIPLIVLPIDLLSFTGKEENSKAVFDWEVTASSDPASFELEKSADGNSFNRIARIAGIGGQSSAAGTRYQYNDATITNGKFYYRLKMTDNNGRITYSNVVILDLGRRSLPPVTIFPTILSSSSFFVRSATALHNAQLQLVDISGKRVSPVMRITTDAGQRYSVRVPAGLPPGIYMIQLQQPDNTLFVQKMVIK